MTLSTRAYDDSRDHNTVMGFLRNLYAETGGLENWLPTRFENNSRSMDPGIHLWFDDDMLVGLVVPEEPLMYYVTVHPGYILLYPEMVTWIETYSRSTWKGTLTIVEMEDTVDRENVLREHGFSKGRVSNIFRIRDLSAQIPDYKLHEGFRVRSVTPDDFDELASCIRQVFGHKDFNRTFLEINATASYYNSELDLVVVDEQDKIVSFCTFRLDPPTGLTELEPMGTLPEYRNMGIGRALLSEGFKRLEKHNPSLLYIGGAANNPPANRLYELTGFTEKHDLVRWEKPLRFGTD
jgi:ribosomal protein S18 acetylase RimI-like enzyme